MRPISESALEVLTHARYTADLTGFDARIDLDRGDHIIVTPSFTDNEGQRRHMFLLCVGYVLHEIRGRDVAGLIESCLRRQGIEAVEAAIAILAEVAR